MYGVFSGLKRDRVNINSDSLYVVHLLCNIVWVYFSVVCICACVHRMCLYMCMSMCEYSDISWETFKVFRSNRREVFHKIFYKVLRKVLLMETFNQVTWQGTCFPRVFQNSLFIEHFQVATSENLLLEITAFCSTKNYKPFPARLILHTKQIHKQRIMKSFFVTDEQAILWDFYTDREIAPEIFHFD